MQRKPNNNVAYFISILLITLFFGCTVQQTHKTLTFFFDGVDKVVFFNDYLSHDTLGKIAAAKRDALLKKNRPDLCVHKPYKEKKCEACHTPDKRLLMPMPDLCFKCHTSFSQTYKVVHGPVASGGCLNCHNQHSAKYPKLLIRQGQQICLYCHNGSLVFANKVHRDIEDAECTMCHNPHGGKTRYMLKDNISRDANRIGLMDDISYRHLYGQVFCKVPGDANNVNEITILDSKGVVVATAHPDANGKFFLANLHPDQNYTFRLKKEMTDCKINIMDNNGTLLYVIEKNRKDKYVFDKANYEAVHTAMNDARFLGDTLTSDITKPNVINNSDVPSTKDTASAPLINGINKVEEPAKNNQASGVVAEPVDVNKKGKIVVANLPDTVTTQKYLGLDKEPVKAENPDVKKAVDTSTYKGKIVVKDLPGDKSLKKLVDENKLNDTTTDVAVQTPKVDTEKYSGKIVVYSLPDNEKLEKLVADNKKKDTTTDNKEKDIVKPAQPGNKSRIVVADLPDTSDVTSTGRFRNMAGATEVIRKFEEGGVKLSDLTLQIGKYYEGTVVCILNDAGDLVDIANVNGKGEFYMYDFLYYRLSLPPANSGIITQSIFLNEKMEVIEVMNKRLVNGRYSYRQNSKEPENQKATVRIFANNANAVLFSSIYFVEGKATITDQGINELKKTVEYLNNHPKAKVYLASHAGSHGTTEFNRQLSDKRAKATMDYLTGNGISADRIREKGYGNAKRSKKFEITPGSDEENQKNRRVDIYIKVN